MGGDAGVKGTWVDEVAVKSRDFHGKSRIDQEKIGDWRLVLVPGTGVQLARTRTDYGTANTQRKRWLKIDKNRSTNWLNIHKAYSNRAESILKII